ncbi:MAG: homoserine O-acetyltransferase [Desulfobacteraceae bacterium]|nr:homoserine O-acetyltransferase [Desulfobacteraceae bacterium]
MDRKSVGLVQSHTYTFADADEPLVLESGKTLAPVAVAYETYGSPNADRSNAVLICHALSGDAHAAGYHHPHDKHLGWWDGMIGPGKAFDTDRYWVICSNAIGGCKGTTGPASIHPKTGKAHGLDFPIVTIRDMVDVQQRLITHLGIERLYSVAGGSMGGFQVLEWALRYPEKVRSAICLASSARLSAQGIAFNAVGRNAITKDSAWAEGHYEGDGPENGLAIARMVGHITYLSELLMDSKFGRRLQSADRLSYDFSTEFAVESYLNHKGNAFKRRFDANSYLYMTKAMDYFDIERSYGPLNRAFADIQARFMIVAYSTDWLFPSAQSKALVHALLACNKDVSFIEVDSPYGHDAFLVEEDRLAQIMAAFLSGGEKADVLGGHS